MASESPVPSPALRYALNVHEQELLHRYLVRRLHRDSARHSPKAEARLGRAPVHDDYHAATVRSALRVFLGTAAGLKAWELVAAAFQDRAFQDRGKSQR
jgi:hypothetical protein